MASLRAGLLDPPLHIAPWATPWYIPDIGLAQYGSSQLPAHRMKSGYCSRTCWLADFVRVLHTSAVRTNRITQPSGFKQSVVLYIPGCLRQRAVVPLCWSPVAPLHTIRGPLADGAPFAAFAGEDIFRYSLRIENRPRGLVPVPRHPGQRNELGRLVCPVPTAGDQQCLMDAHGLLAEVRTLRVVARDDPLDVEVFGGAHSRFPGAVCRQKMDCEAGGG